MATRFRLTQDTTAPAVSPALQSYTHAAPATLRRKLLTTDSSALTSTAYTPDGADHGGAGDSLWCQFVSDEIAAGKVFASGQTIKMALQGFEAHANNNLNLQLYVAVVSSDGGTVRRVLRSKVEHGTEWANSLISRFLSTTQDGADYTTAANDRLVVELSAEGSPGGGGGVQGHNGTMRFGSDGAGGDLPENDTETGATLNPWIEFVPDIFSEEHFGSVVATGGGVASPVGQKTGLAAVTATGGGVSAHTFAGAHAGALIGTGGGIAAVAQSTARSGVAVGTGGGVAVVLSGKLVQVVIVATGGGVAIAQGAKQGLQSVVATAGGVAQILFGGAHFGQATATGGGVAVVLPIAQRASGAVAATAGGIAQLVQATARAAEVLATGGGVATVVGAPGGGGESHSGTVVATGGGVAQIQWQTARSVVIAGTGGGVAQVFGGALILARAKMYYRRQGGDVVGTLYNYIPLTDDRRMMVGSYVGPLPLQLRIYGIADVFIVSEVGNEVTVRSMEGTACTLTGIWAPDGSHID